MSSSPTVPSRLCDLFRERFGRAATVFSRAPGRVNLIGEHVDYSGGWVLPFAIENYFHYAGSPRDDGLLELYSVDLDARYSVPIDSIRRVEQPAWANYCLGTVQLLGAAGVEVPGFSAAITSTVPVGAGLSSSAAFEVATAGFVLQLAGATMDRMETAKLCRRAENEFVGVPCGLMDQFISVFGRAGEATLLNCRTLEHRQVPLALDGHSFLLIDTAIRHRLGSSEYTKRQEECARGLEAARGALGERIVDLGVLTVEEFVRIRDKMDELTARRLRHVVTENARVAAAVEALRAGDLHRLGGLLSAGHRSLRDDYQVSCPQLDFIQELADADPGVLGGRMVGGGFGGCVLCLVAAEGIDSLQRTIRQSYTREYGLVPTFIEVKPGEGASAFTMNVGG